MADADPLPPSPEQVSPYVLVPGVLTIRLSLPPVLFDPDHAPVALQLVALFEDQVIVIVESSSTEFDEDEILMVGLGVDVVPGFWLLPPPPPPPQENKKRIEDSKIIFFID
tara:strand:- start:77 stop:409 length:333 start_codon:yes stop_codon:yes gene_type:complete